MTCKSPDPPLGGQTEQESGQECGTLPVELRLCLPGAGALLPDLVPPPPGGHRRGRGGQLLRRCQERGQEDRHSRYGKGIIIAVVFNGVFR